MTAQALTKRQLHKGAHKKSIVNTKLRSQDSTKAELIGIADKMLKKGFNSSFVVKALETAFELEGASDLMHLWAEEKNKEERDEIISDIQDMIDACSQKEKSEEMYIKFNDLDAIAKDIRAFKDSLYQEVTKRGGINRLSELTGIPQPSLSRFFNSNAMPHRATVLKIAKALGLEGIKVDVLWSK